MLNSQQYLNYGMDKFGQQFHMNKLQHSKKNSFFEICILLHKICLPESYISINLVSLKLHF